MYMNFLVIFRQRFQTQSFSIHSWHENFALCLTIFKIQPKKFSCEFRPPKASFGSVYFSVDRTVFSESFFEKQKFLGIFKKVGSNRITPKSCTGTINTLYFWKQCVKIYISEFFGIFSETFSKPKFWIHPLHENFGPFSTNFFDNPYRFFSEFFNGKFLPIFHNCQNLRKDIFSWISTSRN